MKFAMMGTGGVGGYFGACLAAAGYEVHFIARGKHLESIVRDGLKIQRPNGDLHIDPANATDDPETIGPVDTIFFTPKLWDTDAASEAIRSLLGPETAVISFQNGVDAENKLSEVLGREHVMGGVAEIASTIAEPGMVRRLSPFARLIFGELDGGRSARAEALLQCCQEAGIETKLSDDIHTAIWRKFILLVPFSGVTAVTRKGIGSIRNDPLARQLLVELMEETTTVAQASGAKIDNGIIQEWMAVIDGYPPETNSSMARDLQSGGRLETEWFQGEVVRLGGELNILTPANRFVYAALKLSANGVG